MAIAYDNSDSFMADQTGTHTKSFTVATGACLFVVGSQHLSSITYNGASLTKLTDFTPAITDGNEQIVKVFWLSNPSSGSNTLDCTVSAGNTSPISMISYTGLDTTTQPENSSNKFTNNGLANTQEATLSNSVSTSTNNAWTVLFAVISTGTQTVTASTGTLRTATGVTIYSNSAGIIDTNAPISPTGSSTLVNGISSGSAYMSNVMYSLKPYVVPERDATFFMFME